MLSWHCPGYHRDHSHNPLCDRSLMRLAVVAVTMDFELVARAVREKINVDSLIATVTSEKLSEHLMKTSLYHRQC